MIKGLWKFRMRLADGRWRWYVYAWRGKKAPLLGTLDAEQFPKTLPPEMIARYAETISARAPKDSFEELVVDYLGSPEWKALADSTKKIWTIWLDRAREKFGAGPLEAFEHRRFKGVLLKWRDGFAASPRNADYAIQVIRRVLSWGVQRGRLSVNIAENVPSLYKVDRAHIIIEPHELAAFVACRPPAHGQALALACYTGLRRGDLVSLTWGEVGDLAIRRKTLKSRGRREAVIPITDEARALLAEIPKRGVQVLTNAHGKPWRPESLSQAIARGLEAIKVEKHLHDARGTYATLLARAGFEDSEIAEAMGWAREDVAAIRRKYVDGTAIVLSAVERLRNAGRQMGVKRDDKK